MNDSNATNQADDEAQVVHDNIPAEDYRRPAQIRLDPFPADPLLSKVVDWPPKRRLLALGLPLLALCLAITIAALEGNLLHERGVLVFGTDVGAALFGGTQVSGMDVPFSRDLPHVVALLGAWLTPILVFVQWTQFRTFVEEFTSATLPAEPIMWSTRAAPDEPSYLEQGASRFNSQCDRLGGFGPLRVFVAALMAAVLMRGQRADGVFGAFLPSGESPDAAYRNWWASIDASTFGFLFYFGSATAFLYYLFLQNEVGFRFLRYLSRGHGKIIYDFDLANGDGAYGWLSARRLLFVIYLSLATHGLMIAAVGLVMSPESYFSWMLPLLILYFIVTPTYIFGTSLFFRPGRKRAKQMAIERATLAAKRSLPPHEKEAHRVEVDRIRDVPNTLLTARQRAVQALPLVIALAALVAQVIAVLLILRTN